MPLVKPSGIVTLTTDIGGSDPRTGRMRGVLLSRHQALRIVDLAHAPGAPVATVARWLAESAGCFPSGTVHLALAGRSEMDAALVAEAGGQYFVALDNGTLAEVLAREPGAEVRRLEPDRFGGGLAPDRSEALSEIGRDLLAPCAAELAAGRFWISEMGQIVTARA